MDTNALLRKVTNSLLFALCFFTPLLVFPATSEAFEFNKMVFVYGITIGMVAMWALQSVNARKLLFARTPLDIPIILYLFALGIGTVFSIDPHTSIFGVYGRFNGGLLSHISYALIYWITVTLVSKATAQKAAKLLLTSGIIVAGIAVIEHFGTSLTCIVMTGEGVDPLTHLRTFNHSCWTQDFQSRVFSTLGQPNWLAAWLVALTPLTWGFALEANRKQRIILSIISLLFLFAIIYTKSRSGLLGLMIATGVFIITSVFTSKALRNFRKPFTILTIVTLVIILLVGTPWTPSLRNLNNSSEPQPNDTIVITDSLTIRKHVWQGALNIWRDYRWIGSGPETFVLMFPRYSPVEFNMTSEWDFVFNKSHNQYLDILANTGVLGILTYLSIPVIFLITSLKRYRSKQSYITLGIISGYMSLLVTQFFGFQVVTTSLLLFLLPAFAFTDKAITLRKEKAHPLPTLLIVVITLFGFYSLANYWQADVHYNKAVESKFDGQFSSASIEIKQAIDRNPIESIYVNELADIQSYLAVVQSENSNDEIAIQLASESLDTSEQALLRSPHNHKYMERRANILIRMSVINPEYLFEARDTVEILTKLLPTDPETHYNYALLLSRTGDSDHALAIVDTSIVLKPNYKEPRFLKAKLLVAEDQTTKALHELEHIRQHIDPYDDGVNKLYEKLNQN